MKKFLGSGGLGDFLICFSKCYNYVDKDEKFHFTHIDEITNRRTKVDYNKYANEFLSHQPNVEFNIIQDKQFEYYKKHGKEYDYCFSPQVYGDVDSFLLRPNSGRHDSQPYIKFGLPYDLCDEIFLEKKQAITINCFAGNGDDPRRMFNSQKFLQDLIKYLNIKLGYVVYLIGIKDENKLDYCYDVRDLSFCEQLVYLIHSDKIICFNGFIPYFASFSNKKVIVKWESEAATKWYYHPEWLENNVKFWYNETFSEIIDKL